MTDDPNARRGRAARKARRRADDAARPDEARADEARPDAARPEGAADARADTRPSAGVDEPRVIHLGERSFANTNIAADQRERDRERQGGLKSTDRRTTQGPVNADGHEVPEDEWD